MHIAQLMNDLILITETDNTDSSVTTSINEYHNELAGLLTHQEICTLTLLLFPRMPAKARAQLNLR